MDAIRRHLSAGNGLLKVAALVGAGSGTVQRVKREMAEQLAERPRLHPGETVWGDRAMPARHCLTDTARGPPPLAKSDRLLIARRLPRPMDGNGAGKRLPR